MIINDFLTVPYVDGGRTLSGLDCWGQVRLARAKLFGKDLARSYGHVLCANKGGMTAAFSEMMPYFREVEPQAGAIACCFRHNTLIHVGLVVEEQGLKVLHTNAKRGGHLLSLSAFERLALSVKYFDDQGNA
ncbi:NlpC/P60 family protein [Photobacterium leiognathi]|uniref:NlpC/P60 family protein n=1 Tax=Photobacterium leiognathi TaxID=553611 RepID=UPI000D171D53|nr:NlpC/P60 family protein [Photobacterium leiognathi]PSW53062.1 phage tail protein [Photobacterium leiognathi subsp. mandapamensis]